MNPNDDQTNPSPQPSTISSPQTNPQCSNLAELDDMDDDDDGADDDCLDSLDDIQQILQTFGSNESSLTIEYFDSRRYEIMYEIMNIEKQFDELKNILYDESVSLIDQKLNAIQNEEAPEYQDEVKKLYDDMQLRLQIAEQRRQIELQSLENLYQAELLSLQQTLENDKLLLNEQIHDEIQRKIDELETLKNQTQLCSNILQEMFPQNHHHQQQLISPNKKRFETSDAFKENKKQRKLNFTNGSSVKTVDKDNLAIFYQLSDIDIIEDWAMIQSTLTHDNHQQHDDDDDDDDDEDDDDDDDDDDEETSQLNINTFKQEQLDYDENRV